MFKILLLLLCGLLTLLDPEMTLADPAAAPEASTEADVIGDQKVPRPNYKRYRGNSRRRRGPFAYFRRRAARRKARRKARHSAPAPRRKGVITVDPPKGTMPPRQ
ncbi:hypothetical protein [Hymenobacter weizhouensis]|uniref:hypothetical protein n=1 Tax=Hymenobacter sp. YIM 151500-1 TaxID=2987689 RepID=UPI0022274694|nr:hypothetical protein [Hymenobacter sp. YIM 151500-1]UYZ62322.1 hypothetical protein OIS53_15145 [Hymenobacter sp. YIM 151500-1]